MKFGPWSRNTALGYVWSYSHYTPVRFSPGASHSCFPGTWLPLSRWNPSPQCCPLTGNRPSCSKWGNIGPSSYLVLSWRSVLHSFLYEWSFDVGVIARLGNMTRPKIGKRRVSDPQDLKICGKYEKLIVRMVEVNQRMQDRRLVPYFYTSENTR